MNAIRTVARNDVSSGHGIAASPATDEHTASGIGDGHRAVGVGSETIAPDRGSRGFVATDRNSVTRVARDDVVGHRRVCGIENLDAVTRVSRLLLPCRIGSNEIVGNRSIVGRNLDSSSRIVVDD